MTSLRRTSGCYEVIFGRLYLGALFGSLSLSGCSSSSDTQSETPPAAESILEDIEIDLERSFRIISSAEDVMISDCMRKEGFEFFPLQDRTSAESSVSLFDDPQEWNADTEGYTPLSNTDNNLDQTSQATYLATLSESELATYGTAFFGTEATSMEFGNVVLEMGLDGCLAEARAEVAGAEPAEAARIAGLRTFVSVLVSDVTARVEADLEFLDAVELWQACMGDAGFAFESPGTAAESAQSEFGRESDTSPTDQEIAQAVSDRACQVESNIADIYRERFLHYERDLVEEGDGRLIVLEWNEVRELLLTRSMTILSDAGVSFEE